jgi:hypothetical protein
VGLSAAPFRSLGHFNFDGHDLVAAAWPTSERVAVQVGRGIGEGAGTSGAAEVTACGGHRSSGTKVGARKVCPSGTRIPLGFRAPVWREAPRDSKPRLFGILVDRVDVGKSNLVSDSVLTVDRLSTGLTIRLFAESLGRMSVKSASMTLGLDPPCWMSIAAIHDRPAGPI